MKKTLLLAVVTSCAVIILQAAALRAETAYNIDSKDIPLRATPNSKGKVLVNVPPGTGVELQQSSRWVLVQYSAALGGPKTGWIDPILLGPKPPEGVLTKQLEHEAIALRDRVAALEKERAELMEKDKKLGDKLTKVEANYDELKNASTNYLQLKQESETAKAGLAKAKEDLEGLSQENKSLKITEKIKWFTAGGFVLVLGWVIGLYTGRQQKKRRSTYF